MNRKLFLLFSLLFLFGFSLLHAQDSIVEALQTNVSDTEGTIEIESDYRIAELIGKPSDWAKVNSDNYDVIHMTGFRIQVFMGNDPKTSRAEVFNKQSQIRNVYTDIETYVSYDAPNWKLLVGDFTTRDEANLFKEVLRKEFPQFGREMYVVTSTVNVSVEK